ncbi:hypothetical protein V1512DRAFT_274977 [Lipomyces arxii]|uniref:uncharacterized protein n=1 Tax=Lipomyces arxii TaxID=56418 RepID=UPI0034CF5652
MTSYQTATTSTHYNDALPIHFANASVGQTGKTRLLHKQALRSLGTHVEEENAAKETIARPVLGSDASAEQTIELLHSLLALRSTLPSREHKHYSSKLLKVVPTLSNQHTCALYNILRLVIVQGDKLSAKEDLLSFMMLENGVASWGNGLRRIIDSCEPQETISRPPSESSWVEVIKEEL